MRMTQRAHEVVRAAVRAGDTVVDATIGNGHDTLFLARLVGPSGRVFGFDVQEEALTNTKRRLEESDEELGEVTLVQTGHETMSAHVSVEVSAVMFNLGYLPGGDHQVTTQRESTRQALNSAWELLAETGVICVVCYRGHPGGREEAEAVLESAKQLSGAQVQIEGHNKTEDGPFLVVVRK